MILKTIQCTVRKVVFYFRHDDLIFTGNHVLVINTSQISDHSLTNCGKQVKCVFSGKKSHRMLEKIHSVGTKGKCRYLTSRIQIR